MANGAGTPPGAVPQPGMISANPLTGITNQAHPDYANIKWVPSWVATSRIQGVVSLIGAIGGVFLGAGLQPKATDISVSTTVVRLVAQACVANAQECTALHIGGQAPGVNFYFWIGLVFLTIFGVATCLNLFSTKQSKTAPESAD